MIKRFNKSIVVYRGLSHKLRYPIHTRQWPEHKAILIEFVHPSDTPSHAIDVRLIQDEENYFKDTGIKIQGIHRECIPRNNTVFLLTATRVPTFPLDSKDEDRELYENIHALIRNYIFNNTYQYMNLMGKNPSTPIYATVRRFSLLPKISDADMVFEMNGAVKQLLTGCVLTDDAIIKLISNSRSYRGDIYCHYQSSISNSNDVTMTVTYF